MTTPRITGEFRTTVKRGDKIVSQTPWLSNQVQDTGMILLAGLVSGLTTGPGLYLAVGSGDAAWDAGWPIPPVLPAAQTHLIAEIGRKSLSGLWGFVNPITAVPSATPTNTIYAAVEFADGECEGTWREYGIFGGAASIGIDTGSLINWKAHTPVTKGSGVVIVREVKLTFSQVFGEDDIAMSCFNLENGNLTITLNAELDTKVVCVSNPAGVEVWVSGVRKAVIDADGIHAE